MRIDRKKSQVARSKAAPAFVDEGIRTVNTLCVIAQRRALVRPLRFDALSTASENTHQRSSGALPMGHAMAIPTKRIALTVQGHKKWVFAGMVFGVVWSPQDFQADDEGLIPFTRSKQDLLNICQLVPLGRRATVNPTV